MANIYKKSVVAFVDLLGFKEALKDEANAKEILDILHQIKHGEIAKCSATTLINGSVTEVRVKPSVSAFSDNVVMSVSEDVFTDVVSWRHAVMPS